MDGLTRERRCCNYCAAIVFRRALNLSVQYQLGALEHQVRVLETRSTQPQVSMHACLQNHQIARVRRGYAVVREHGQARSSTPIMSLQPPSFPSPRCLSASYNYLSRQAHLRLLLRFSGRPNLVYFVQAPSRLALPGKTQKGPSPIPVSDPVGCTSVSWCADHSDPGTPVMSVALLG
ncbi:hypothetical protein J3E68DRAFT_57847 [Trichoderma sp. SZMC 28012]